MIPPPVQHCGIASRLAAIQISAIIRERSNMNFMRAWMASRPPARRARDGRRPPAPGHHNVILRSGCTNDRMYVLEMNGFKRTPVNNV